MTRFWIVARSNCAQYTFRYLFNNKQYKSTTHGLYINALRYQYPSFFYLFLQFNVAILILPLLGGTYLCNILCFLWTIYCNYSLIFLWQIISLPQDSFSSQHMPDTNVFGHYQNAKLHLHQQHTIFLSLNMLPLWFLMHS